jgi:NADH-quinone oxidoreductase subunit N
MNSIVLTAIWGVVMMYAGILFKGRKGARIFGITGILLLLAVNWLEYSGTALLNIQTQGMIQFSGFAAVVNAIAFICTGFYFLLSGDDISEVGDHEYDYYALIFFVLCGVSILTTFQTLLMLFLGIEILSIPLYILAGADKRNLKSNEASLKYFLMGSFSTGILLMGIAFMYGDTGTFYIQNMNIGLGGLSVMMTLGMVLLLIALSFKVSAAPFHFWTPDVYDGSPTVFTSFMATVVKAAGFVAFLRLFENAFGKVCEDWQMLVAIITASTLFIGNITAVFQQSVKRMLAYSSIAQAGFMMFAILTMNVLTREGLVLYAAAYSLATIGIFAILLRMKDYTFEGYNGLAKKEPLLAFLNTVFLLSLAGIPLTAGFFAKYYMLLGTVKNGHHLWLVIFAVLCAAVSVYYYFRVIQAMYFREGDAEVTHASSFFRWTLVVTAAIVVVLGLYPTFLLKWLYY